MRICLRCVSLLTDSRLCQRAADDDSDGAATLRFQLDADHRQLADSQLQDRQGRLGRGEHTDQLSSGSAELLLHFRATKRIALRSRRRVDREDRIQSASRTGDRSRLSLYVNCPADLSSNARAGPRRRRRERRDVRLPTTITCSSVARKDSACLHNDWRWRTHSCECNFAREMSLGRASRHLVDSPPLAAVEQVPCRDRLVLRSPTRMGMRDGKVNNPSPSPPLRPASFLGANRRHPRAGPRRSCSRSESARA